MTDKIDLLNEISLDRSRSRPRQKRPVALLLTIAIVIGLGFVGWYFWWPERAIEVRTAMATSPALTSVEESVLDATGFVVARRAATVSSKQTGKVMTVLVEEGMYVEEGDLLATLDDSIQRASYLVAKSQVEQSKSVLEEIDVQIEQAKLDLKRITALVDRDLASRDSLDRNRLRLQGLIANRKQASDAIEVASRSLEVQKLVLDDMKIRAPFSGVVVNKSAQPGEMISPVSGSGGFTRTGICTLVDMDSLEVEVDVAESRINRVKPSQEASVTLTAYPDTKLPAEVIAIIPTADRAKATVRVRIKFKQKDERVLPDMAVKVNFLEEGAVAELVNIPAGVTVPSSSVSDADGESSVWVVKNDVVEKRLVVVAEENGQRMRLTSGLRKGERVVVNINAELLSSLSDGVAVRVLN